LAILSNVNEKDKNLVQDDVDYKNLLTYFAKASIFNTAFKNFIFRKNHEFFSMVFNFYGLFFIGTYKLSMSYITGMHNYNQVLLQKNYMVDRVLSKPDFLADFRKKDQYFDLLRVYG